MSADPFSAPVTATRSPARWTGLAAIALATIGCVWATVAMGALYKWVDANGRVVYSDQPPPGNVKVEEINAASPSANPQAVREMATKEAEFQKRQAERAKAEQQSVKDRATAEQKAAACARAGVQAKELAAGNVPIYRLNEKGERVVMDDASRARERQRLEQWVKENCGR